MLNSYELFEENMQKEMKQYINDVSDELYSYNHALSESIPNDENYKELMYSSSEIMEELYDRMNDYVNVRTDDIFNYNINESTSRQCKLMIMSIYYEYCTVYYQELDKVNQQIYNHFASNPNSNKAIEFYDKYFKYILEIYDFYLGLYYNMPYETDKMRSIILDKEEYKNVINIDAFAIFRYRFLKGIKFDNEEIKSISVGKQLIAIVQKIIDKDMNDDQNIKQVQLILEENDEISEYVNGYKDYMISSIYEIINSKSDISLEERQFIKEIENKHRDDILNNISTENNNLSTLLYSFYIFNNNKINEDNLLNRRKNTIKKKKLELVKQYNPFYIEESIYLKNKGDQ